MKTYLISVAATCLLLVLLEMMLSEGKTKKYVQGILRLAVVIIVLTPLVGLVNKNFSFDDIFDTEKTTAITANYGALDEFLIEKTERAIERKLNVNSAVRCSAKIVCEQGVIKNVIITVKENGINEHGENIFTNEKIIEAVVSVIDVDKDRIIVYGTEQ